MAFLPVDHDAEIMNQKLSVFSRHPRFVVASVLVSLGGLLFLGSCLTEFFCPIAFPFTRLGALKSDPMAEYEPPGTELLDAEYRQHSQFPASLAGVTRTFRITDADLAGRALADFVNEATLNGWTLEEENRFCKELETGIALLGIGLREGAVYGTRSDRLVISMGYNYGAPFGDRFIEAACPWVLP